MIIGSNSILKLLNIEFNQVLSLITFFLLICDSISHIVLQDTARQQLRPFYILPCE